MQFLRSEIYILLLIKIINMQIGRTEQDVEQWNNSMHVYEKQKRTKKPFGKQFNPIDNLPKHTKADQSFDIIQHQFRTPDLKNAQQKKQHELSASSLNRYYLNGGRNARNFDIITLYGAPQQNTSTFKSKQPVRNIYNPINNQPLPQNYYAGKNIRLPLERNFKNIKPGPRDFNIVTGNYIEHNLQKKAQQQQSRVKMIHNNMDTKLDYNPLTCQYYNSQKQKQYQSDLCHSQILQSSGQQYNKRFPPTYLQHQPLILDPSKPLSQSVAALDTRRQNAKQRYKLKYMLEKQYQLRNIQYQNKKQRMLRNRVYNSHSIDGKAKQFRIQQLRNVKDSLANQIYGPIQTKNRLQNYYNPEARSEVFSGKNRSQISSSRGNQGRDRIKSGGFDNY